MEFAEMADDQLRAHLDRAGAAGVIPSRAALLDLQVPDREADGFEHGQRVGLGIEDADSLAAAIVLVGPQPALAVQCRGATADAATCDAALALGRVVLIGAGDFEQGDVAVTLVGIALGGRQQAGSSEGRMSDMSDAIGFSSFSAGAPPPKSVACAAGMKDQVTASSMPRAASAAARRERICSVVRIFWLTSPRRGRGCALISLMPWMRMTSSTRSALPSTSGRQDGT